MKRRRVIQLDPPTDVRRLKKIADMLIGIYTDDSTDQLYVRVKMGSYDFVLRGPAQPSTKAKAVQLAQDFMVKIDFSGSVRWQVGKGARILKNPKIA